MKMTTFDSTEEFVVEVRDETFSRCDEELVPLTFSRSDERVARFQRAADEKKARIQRNHTLSDSQRRNALEMLCQQTEAEMRCALGDRNFHAFKAFHLWWFREIATVN
jgi:hypothetical protein